MSLGRGLSSLLAVCAASAALVAGAPASFAESEYPTGTVEVVVPFAAGGAVDVTGRLIADGLSKALSRTFLVVNRPGANSNVGNLAVARAKPDGKTLLVSSIGLAANKALYEKLMYDPLTDLTPISLISIAPVGLFLNKEVPVKNLSEFIAYLKANPGKVNYASYGVGSSPHLAAELFQSVTGTKMTHVPFSGNGPATTATLTGTTQVIFCTTVAAGPYIESGGLKAIAFADDERSEQLPDMPTFKELGVDFTMGTFFGLLGPAKLPQPLVDMLAGAVKQTLKQEDVRKIFIAQGAKPVGSSPAEFASFLKSESERLAKVIHSAGITAK
jgi:tripartite-type tricarboxylate transporter receptor subunit TctC